MDIAVAVFRSFIQLTAVGYVIQAIFDTDSLWLVAALLAGMVAFGAWTASLLVRDPNSLATERNHPAWRGMYLLMLANQIGVWLVYQLG